MARRDYTDDYEDFDAPPRNQQQGQRGNNQQNQQNQQRHNNNQQGQQNQQRNRDKPNFIPPPVRATDKDPLYQMLFRFAPEGLDETFLIPSTVYLIQGKGIVDGRSGIRRSQTKGYAIYDSDGTLFFVHENDSEYGYFRQRVDEWTSVWNNLVKLADDTDAPKAQRRNRRAAATRQEIVQRVILPWYARLAMGAALIVVILLFFMTRG